MSQVLTPEEQALATVISRDLREALGAYVGRPSTAMLRETMKAHLTTQLGAFAAAYSIPAPLPLIEVLINGPEVTFKFYDRQTQLEINLGDWLTNTGEKI